MEKKARSREEAERRRQCAWRRRRPLRGRRKGSRRDSGSDCGGSDCDGSAHMMGMMTMPRMVAVPMAGATVATKKQEEAFWMKEVV